MARIAPVAASTRTAHSCEPPSIVSAHARRSAPPATGWYTSRGDPLRANSVRAASAAASTAASSVRTRSGAADSAPEVRRSLATALAASTAGVGRVGALGEAALEGGRRRRDRFAPRRHGDGRLRRPHLDAVDALRHVDERRAGAAVEGDVGRREVCEVGRGCAARGDGRLQGRAGRLDGRGLLRRRGERKREEQGDQPGAKTHEDGRLGLVEETTRTCGRQPGMSQQQQG